MVRTRLLIALLIIPCMVIPATHLNAVTTMRLTIDSFEDFHKGELKSTSLSSDGKLFIAPAIEEVFSTGEDLIWDIAIRDNEAYLATGNEGKIFAVNLNNKKSRLVCDQKELEIYTITLSPDNDIYFGASPGGKIYKITDNSEPEMVFETKQDYVWDMIFDAEGNFYVATGREGKIFKVSARGKGEEYFDSPAANITTLALTPNGDLLAGTHADAFIYRITDKGKAAVLYEPGQAEVKQLISRDDGTIYAALNSEISPRDLLIEQMIKMLESGNDKNDKSKSTPTPSPRAVVIKISPEGFVTATWSPKEHPLNFIYHDADSGFLYASAGKEGRLYQVDDRGEFLVVTKLEEKYVMVIEPSAKELLLGTGSDGVLYRLKTDEYKEGIYVSDILDAGTTVKWGQLEFLAGLPQKSRIEFRYRTGNTKEPDDTWYEWSKFREAKTAFIPLEVPVSRFIQVESKLTNGKSVENIASTATTETENITIIPISEQLTGLPSLDYVTLYYIGANEPPEIKKVVVSPASQKKTPTPPTKEDGTSNSKASNKDSHSEVCKEPDSNLKKFAIQWQVTDPNKDTMLFDLYFKGEGERIWKLIKDELKEPKYEFDTATIPDGIYRIKLVATDSPSNLEGKEHVVEYITGTFIVDNTPPEFKVMEAKTNGAGKVSITASVKDETTILSSAKYAVDARDAEYLLPVDGLFDSREEQFEFSVDDIETGEHSVSLIVTDDAGNTSIKKTLFTIK